MLFGGADSVVTYCLNGTTTNLVEIPMTVNRMTGKPMLMLLLMILTLHILDENQNLIVCLR